MRSPKQLIAETAKFFATNPDAFMQGTLARDKRDYVTQPDNPRACRFCTVGYLTKLIIEDRPHIHVLGNADTCRLVSETLGIPANQFIHYNDDHDREDVVEFLKEKANGLD